MKNYFLKIVILLMHFLITATTVGFCIISFMANNDVFYNSVLFIYGIMETVLFLFIILYYLNLLESFSQSSPFLSLFLAAFQISLLLITYHYSDVMLPIRIGQLQAEKNLIFCAIFMNLMLCGYGILSHNKSKTTVKSFLFGSLIASIAFSSFLPKIQGEFDFVKNFWVIIVFSLGTVINVVVYLILLFSDPFGTQSFRHLVGLSMTTVTWFFYAFHSFSMVFINLNFLVIILILVFAVCKRNSIKL